MEVSKLSIDREKAAELWRKYQSHRVHQTPEDAAIAQIYKRIGKGQTVIRAIESIRAAGLDPSGRPRLAIARADEKSIAWHTGQGEGVFAPNVWNYNRVAHNRRIRVSWPEITYKHLEGRATVPLIPVHVRPRRGIQNYHVLWEAEWEGYPVDPYLLRRFGADAWLVVAAWDLTEIERAVMSQKLNG